MTRVGIVTGMRVEQDCLATAIQALPEPQRPLLFCAGGSNERAHTGARGMLDQGAQALLSLGIAGGLAAGLNPGDVILSDLVIGHDNARREAHRPWRMRVEAELDGVRVGSIYASQGTVQSPEHKSDLHQTHGAMAVDMESGGVSAAAETAGVPFLALRVIADPAHRAIPRAALHGLAPDGRQRAMAVLLQLMRRPGDVPGLIGLARDSKAALARLRRVAALGSALFTPPVA